MSHLSKAQYYNSVYGGSMDWLKDKATFVDAAHMYPEVKFGGAFDEKPLVCFL